MEDRTSTTRLPEPEPTAPYLGLDSSHSAWNRAAAAHEHGDPFACRTEWMLSFHETFAPRRSLSLRAAGDSVLAFAVEHHPRVGRMLVPVESHWQFGCPVLGEDAVHMLDELLASMHGPEGDGLALVSGVLPGRSLAHRLIARFAGHGVLQRLGGQALCAASLAGGLDGFLSRRSGKLRRNLRAAARRAADRGVVFERHAPATEADARGVYDRMLAVEQRSWKGIGRCGMAEPPSREFYGVMLRRLAVSGSGRVVFARADDGDVGFVFGGLAGPVYRGQQFSFDDAWRAHSLGNLLQLEQIRWLCEEGVERYDLGPMMDYKPHWAEQTIHIETWLVAAR